MCRFDDKVFLEETKKVLSCFLKTSSTRLSCLDAVRLVASKQGLSTRRAAAAINHLVTTGFFRYVYDCGQSFLEKNYSGVVRLSERVMLAPPGIDVSVPEEMVVLRIRPGAAFGDCRHPTTRLSVKAIDFALAHQEINHKGKKMLDIGTGSGILAIAAALLGMEQVLAIDIDPCARKEARENVDENGLRDRITVSDRKVDKIAERFILITSNLRPPTLIHYAEQISEKTTRNGFVVLSGMKEEESATVALAYKQFDCIWKESEDGWSAAVFLKKRGLNGN